MKFSTTIEKSIKNRKECFVCEEYTNRGRGNFDCYYMGMCPLCKEIRRAVLYRYVGCFNLKRAFHNNRQYAVRFVYEILECLKAQGD